MRVIGSIEEPVAEEGPRTIDFQMQSLVAGTIPVVMLPHGSHYAPPVPDRFSIVRTSGPGAGTYIFDPAKVTAETIAEASLSGTHGALLGHVQSKAEAGWNCFVVCAKAMDGTPIQESVVSADRDDLIERQKQILLERHPQARSVTLEAPARVLSQR